MYKVKWKDTENKECFLEFEDLALAMNHSKTLDHFVTIEGGELVIVGKFGVDAVEDGKCPDGHDYTWKKRRI